MDHVTVDNAVHDSPEGRRIAMRCIREIEAGSAASTANHLVVLHAHAERREHRSQAPETVPETAHLEGTTSEGAVRKGCPKGRGAYGRGA